MDDENSFDDQDIAIIGMSLRFPGANNPAEFWNNLQNGVESVRFYSDEELLEEGVSSSVLRNPHYVKAGAPLDEMEYFDPEFFGFSPKEGGILDPQHRHFYECAWEALENAGHVPEKFEGAIGLYAGCGMGAYFAYNLITNPELVDSVGLFLLRHTGNDKDFLSSRVSYSFDLKGPSVNIQTACSTSLVATHLACQSLLSGECDMALAGGSTIELPHRIGYMYKEGEILSPDGHCRAFDRESKGTIFGSGAGLVVLRRAEDALTDGDHIYAIIKGTAINNDGSGKVGYLAPSVDGQAAAIVEALAVADVDADSIDYVECHGTGTPVGDPIEVSALTQAFRETSERNGYCGIGSVKSNIGHLDTAAGVASLIKASLSLQNKKMPPSLNYKSPNPTIDFSSSPFYVNDSLREWEAKDSPRRAGVNSLGVGGTNAFAILEEANFEQLSDDCDRDQHLIVLSARNRKSLDAQSQKLAEHLLVHPEQSLADVSFTLLKGRRRFEHRRVLACSDHEEAAELLQQNDVQRVATYSTNSDSASIVFMFPGGGAQYASMGRDLYKTESVFRQHVDSGIELLKSRTGVDLGELLFVGDKSPEQQEAELELPSVQLPAIFIIEYALVQLWKSFGIEPAALIGHSMGENTAACISGVLSFADALGLVRLRGELMDDVPSGGMLSVELPADQLTKYLGDSLDLASVNSPDLSAASGPSEALDELADTLTNQGIEHQRIRINIAAHSRMLEGILGKFGDYLKSIELKDPEIPFISNRSGTWITNEQATSPEYWVEHLRNTVNFSDGVQGLLQVDDRVLLEVGPGNTLSSLAKHQPDSAPQRMFSTLRHADAKISDDAHLVTVLGKLWMAGVDLDSTALWPDQKRQRVALPTYAFQHQRYWIEPGSASHASETSYAQLEKEQNFDQWFYEPVWLQQGILAEVSGANNTWLVFMDDGEFGIEICNRLRKKGESIITVHQGDAYYKLSNDSYRLSPEQGADGYAALVKDLVATGKFPNRILHLWLHTETETFRPGSSFFHRNQEHGFYSLFFLAKAFGNEEIPKDGLHWIVATNGMQQVQEEPVPYPEKATALGPCKIIPREFSGFSCTSVDLPILKPKSSFFGRQKSPVQDSSQIFDMFEVELNAKPGNAVVAYRDGVRWEQHFQHLSESPNETGPSKLRHNGVYLITGGLGGIGFVIGKHLSENYGARIVAVNRTPLPDRGEWGRWLKQHAHDDLISRGIRNVQTLEEAGAEVLAISGDVTNLDRMKQVVEEATEKFGSINGVFHAAGVVRDNLIQIKPQIEIEEVFAPKIYGTLVLDEIFSKESPDFMVLYSSTSTVSAPMGQVDYVAANAFLNAYAHSKSLHSNCQVVAVNWGIWNEVGMAAEAAARMGFGPDVQRNETSIAETRYPLFEGRKIVVEHEQTTHTLTMHLSPNKDWMLDQHRTAKGQALLPGTAYIELVRAALRESGEKDNFLIKDLYFFRALYVADQDTKNVRVKLRTSLEGYSFETQSECLLRDGSAGWQKHAEGRIVLRKFKTADDLDLKAIAKRCGVELAAAAVGVIHSPQEAHLLFGPRWQVLNQIGYGDNEAIASLSLADEFIDDLNQFQIHPALLDLATGFAMRLIGGYLDSEDKSCLWVPISYNEVRFHAPLTQQIRSWVRSHGKNDISDDFARFDVTITDSIGKVLMEVEELTIKQMHEDLDFTIGPDVTESEIERDSISTGTGEVRQLSPSEQTFQHNLTQGILPSEGIKAIERVLSNSTINHVIVSSLDLNGLIEEANAISGIQTESSSSKFSRPELDSNFVEAKDEVERTLVGVWEELLGVDQIGVQDSFFDLGGHSLVAVRLFAKIKQLFDLDYPISVLFEAPTIERCAELIRNEIGEAEEKPEHIEAPRETRFSYLVPMHPGTGGSLTPFFLVAGMFGNVLNLRHLAHLVGADRGFYGLQARGLYGDQDPHATFEEMAMDYIAELRSVQPKGPYMIGGFSGGGITAFEMARQLRQEGETISLLVLLDTPLPQADPLSSVDRMSIHWQRFRRKGASYFSEWAKNRYQWEYQKFQNRIRTDSSEVEGYDFQSEGIEVAFRNALNNYEIQSEPVEVHLFRPRLDQMYALSGDRIANVDREIVFHDNGWSKYVDNVFVHEVPGNHDSMVLEPNVRVLALILRDIIQAEESQVHIQPAKAG